MLSDRARQFEKSEGFFKGNAFDELSWSETSILLALSFALLDIRTVLAETCDKKLSVFRVDTYLAAYIAVFPVAA